MFDKVKNLISETDRFLFRKFGSDKSIKFLENMQEAQKIFSYLNEIGHEAKVRFVGGCVRKSLCGEIVDDIDLATSLTPEEVKNKLYNNNIKVIETGIEHGTITAILNKKKFEITTLRKDVLTDGRHAVVRFTSDWEQDALRRDFTINAIYADIEGRIFDPLNGVSDLRNGIVKFIGSPKERIQEDYLRILRYFRFFFQYSKLDFNNETISEIKKNINGLNKIANERKFDEVKKILSLKNIFKLFQNEKSKEIFLNLFPQFKYHERLKCFDSFDNTVKDKYNYINVLSLLILDQTDNYEFFCYKYKISNKIKEKFKNISKSIENINSKKYFTESNIKKLIYLNSKDFVEDLLLFSICTNNKIKKLDLAKLLNYVYDSKIPKFPVTGDDLKEYGYNEGELMGKKLKFLEEKWIESDFILDKKSLLKLVK